MYEAMRLPRRVSAAAIGVVAWVGHDQVALAQSSQAGGASAEVGRAIDVAVLEDPNADRELLFPTALTQPARTLTVSEYEIICLGITYGIIDRLQVSGMAAWGGGWFLPERTLIGTLKWQLFREGRLRLAVIGGVIHTIDEDPDGGRGSAPRKTSLSPQAGLVTSYCLTDDCHSMLTANIHARRAAGDAKDLGPTMLYSLGGTLRLSKRSKLALEAFRTTEFLRERDSASSPAASGAVRVFGRGLAGELGVIAFFASESYPWPFPYLSATFRF